MKKDEVKNLIEEMFSLIDGNATLRDMSNTYPGFGLFRVKGLILEEQNKSLANHLSSLYLHALEIKKARGLNDIDWINAVIAIFFHDIAKTLFSNTQDLSWEELRILGEKEHHSLSVMRMFLAVNDPVLAHAVRHNSSDFVYDFANSNISVPQLVLNLVDKSDISGKRVTISEKYESIKNKIGHKDGYDDDSEKIACFYLDKILSESISLYEYDFILKSSTKKENIVIVQRFDNKYCSPIGDYEDTNSNVKIAKIISGWGFNTLLINEGNEFYKYNKNAGLVGFPNDIKNKMIPMYCYDKHVVIIEGTTTRLMELKSLFGKYKKIVLLLRTLAEGSVDDYRLENMKHADEVWVMTEQMKSIIEKKFTEKNTESPSIKILQSGYDPKVFYSDSTERIRGKIVYVGALSKIKGVDILIDAFKKIKNEFKSAELHLVGDESIYGSVNNFDKSIYKGFDGIVYHGILKENDVASHLRSAHFSCLLTTIYETFGKSAMQARVCGTRMVVSNKGALPFHVQGEKEGIVLDEVSVNSVYIALKKLINEDPVSIAPPVDRYNYWLHTALDFYSHNTLLTRRMIFN